MSNRRASCARVLLCVFFLGACAPSETPAPKASTHVATTVPAPSPNAVSDSDIAELNQYRRDQAERDSALALVNATQDMLDNIDNELAAIPGMEQRRLKVGGRESTNDGDITASIARKIARAKEMIATSSATIRRLRDENTRSRAENDSLSMERRKVDGAMTLIVATVERQARELVTANERVLKLESENIALNEKVTVALDTVAAMRVREQKVYVAIGTERELLAAQVIVMAGGTAVFGWRPGQTAKPAPIPPKNAYRVLDMLRDKSILLPDDGSYRIISPHHASLVTSAGEAGSLRGRIEIREPERFWEQSKYLILVRND